MSKKTSPTAGQISDETAVPLAYFKKTNPQTPLAIFSGTSHIKFETIGLEPGFISTNKRDIIGSIDDAIKAGIGGVERATKEEYDEFVEKKNRMTQPPRIWREEFGRSVPVPQRSKGPSRTSPAVAAPAAAVEPSPADVAAAVPEVEKRPE